MNIVVRSTSFELIKPMTMCTDLKDFIKGGNIQADSINSFLFLFFATEKKRFMIQDTTECSLEHIVGDMSNIYSS